MSINYDDYFDGTEYKIELIRSNDDGSDLIECTTKKGVKHRYTLYGNLVKEYNNLCKGSSELLSLEPVVCKKGKNSVRRRRARRILHS